MNSKQTDNQVREEQQSPSISPLGRIKTLVRKNLVGTITVTVAGSLLLTGASTWNIWSIYNSFQSTVTKQFELQKLSSQLVYNDEYFTMSARMLVSTGDLQWENRYRQLLTPGDATMKQFLAKITPELRAEAAKTNTAGDILFAMEEKSFKLVREGKQKEAYKVLMGPEYAANKKIFGDGNSKVLAKVENSIKLELENYQQQLLISIVFAGATLPILLASWTFVLSAVRDYIRDRLAAQIEIEKSQTSLLAANKALEVESKIRQEQEKTVTEERDLLQQDIGELLDVICEIEAGDFTVNATVNGRATGLMGDVLNRLVERLGIVFSQVSIEAQRVAVNSNFQEEIATVVAASTSAQTKSVDRVLGLTETVRQSANNAANQLADTDLALASLQTAVTTGELTVGSLDRGIDVLQQGSDRIVQQMKALGEFVGLSDRFVDDQTDIATQTQILALNASLVAARAAEQRDPKQFESVAREFESIAGQVSQLAQKTNEGLTSLEQRNTQIHRVVSDVDGEVQRLGGLVNSFTQGVKQTREVFATVQSVTGKVVKSGEVLAQTSQTIIDSADSTARSIAAIATLSAQIDEQSQTARSISTQMNELSAGLIDNIQIFKLPVRRDPIVSLPMVVETPAATSASDPTEAKPSYQLN
ncbi:methyl-accepting chemotaxis protein [Chamaesiphon sp. VAR_48_metabat_135_sub]|uniref:methyl-accepting chemotaxis protein n=1 Tax=Chamaesiphon sp. VAR_48_metabat_135_sub TaxID=2964699 RepID=UPI00286B8C4E|nr:methyl-accepting chemotaxis protein [Chamaesiphon sp. VAR_48_metabat_135_sub]